MGLTITVIFFIVAFLSLIEEYLGKYKWAIYISLGIVLILLSAFKEVGIDPDSINYEQSFLGDAISYDKISVDPSFLFISAVLKNFTHDVHSLFLVYALLGIGIKLFAFTKYSDRVFLILLSYISYYYILQDCMQIRAGVMTAFFLLSLKPLSEGKKKKALILMLCGSIFHSSGLVLLPLLFLNNKPCTMKGRLRWAALVPIGYVLFLAGFSVLFSVGGEIPYIGDKISIYQQGVEKGVMTVTINVFSPLQLFTLMLYCYVLYFYDTILQYNKYLPLMMKVFSIGLFCFPALAFLPVLAQRISQVFIVVDVILFANIFYTFKQKWAGWLMVLVVGFIYLNYAVPFISFSLFWKGG